MRLPVHALIPPLAGPDEWIQFATKRHMSTFSPRICTRDFPDRFTLGGQRAQGMPGARCTRGPRVQYAREVRTRAYRAAESIRHSLRNGFTTYSALSLVIGFLATIVPETLVSQELDASTEASGPHAFVVRVSPLVKGASASTATRPSFATMANAPLPGTGWQSICPQFDFCKSEIFLISGLDITSENRNKRFARRVNVSRGSAGPCRNGERAASH